MKITHFAAAAAIALSAVPAFAGEGNGAPFALRTPAIASTTVAAARPDTGAEATPPALDVASTAPAGDALFASNAGEASVQPAASLPPGALGGALAYAQAPRPAAVARIATAAR